MPPARTARCPRPPAVRSARQAGGRTRPARPVQQQRREAARPLLVHRLRADQRAVHHRARDHIEDQVRPCGPPSPGSSASAAARRGPGRVPGPRAPAASGGRRSPRGSVSRSASSRVDSATTAISAVLVSGRCEQRRELEHHALDVGRQAAAVGQFQLVEENRDRVDDQLVLVRPAAVEGGLGDPGAGAPRRPSSACDQPSSTSAARVASRIAASASALRGRPVRPVRVGRVWLHAGDHTGAVGGIRP